MFLKLKKQNSKGGKIIKLYHVENIQVNSEKKKKKEFVQTEYDST